MMVHVAMINDTVVGVATTDVRARQICADEKAKMIAIGHEGHGIFLHTHAFKLAKHTRDSGEPYGRPGEVDVL